MPRVKFFRDIGDVTLVGNLFRPIRIINRTNSRTIWTPTCEDIGHIAKSTSFPPPKKNPHIEHFLELMPVVEKPEIVKAKERKLKSLGKKYLVNVFSDVLLLKKTPLLGKSDLRRKKVMD